MIVIGVLLALGASDWEQRREDRQTELDVLRELSTALDADLSVLEDQAERYRTLDARITTLLSALQSQTPYADSLDGYFGTLYGFHAPPLNSAGYESLKSQGLDLISNATLRSAIARGYEWSHTRARDAFEAEREVILELLRPYFLLHFRDLRFNTSATPLDYDFVASDPRFLNLADYRLQNIVQNSLPLVRESITELRALKRAIDRELEGGA